MRLFSICAIFVLFWVMSAIFVLPFGVRTHEDDHLPKVPGQASSAPAHFNAWRVVRRASVLAVISFGLFLANYHSGWVTLADLDVSRLIGGAPAGQ